MDKRQRNLLEKANKLIDAVLVPDCGDRAANWDAVSLARVLCGASKFRDDQLPAFPGISPPWRALLQLFIAQVDGVSISVSDLALVSDVPQTTHLRVQALLVNLGLVQRVADPKDKRRVWLTLTAEGGVRVLAVLKEFSEEIESLQPR